MGRTGARWSHAGAAGEWKLRRLLAVHLAKEQEQNHASRCVDGIVPDPIPQLRLNRRGVAEKGALSSS